jgi:hypothetical protein
MSQTHPRLDTSNASELHVVVTHRFPAPNRYGWELRPVTGLTVEESRGSVRIVGGSQSGRQTCFGAILPALAIVGD